MFLSIIFSFLLIPILVLSTLSTMWFKRDSSLQTSNLSPLPRDYLLGHFQHSFSSTHLMENGFHKLQIPLGTYSVGKVQLSLIPNQYLFFTLSPLKECI